MIRDLFKFAKAKEVIGEPKPLDSASSIDDRKIESLSSEQAILEIYKTLKSFPDTDAVLQKVGMHRGALRKLNGDDEIYAAMSTRRSAVLATPWRLEGGNKRVRDFLTEQLKPRFDSLASGFWESICYGNSITEVVYKVDANAVIVSEAAVKPMEWFTPTPYGQVLYRGQYGGIPYATLPEKYILTVHNGTYINPHGEALFSRLYFPWFFRNHGWEFWGKWIEQNGYPFMVGKTENITDAITGEKSIDVLARLLSGARRGSAIAIDKESDITQLPVSGTGQQFEIFNAAVDRRIQKVLLGQTLTSDTGKGGGGSKALGTVHDSVRDDKRRDDIKLVGSSFQKLIRNLYSLNKFNGDVPQFVMQDDAGLESERAGRDAVLAEKLGVQFTRAYIVESYDVADSDIILKGEDGYIDAPTPAPTPALPVDKKTFKLSTKQISGQENIDNNVLTIADEIDTPITDKLIKGAIFAASSEDDLRTKLGELLVNMEATAFEDTIAKSIFAANVIGYVDAK